MEKYMMERASNEMFSKKITLNTGWGRLRIYYIFMDKKSETKFLLLPRQQSKMMTSLPFFNIS
jgi:hypothetical protein